MVARQSTAIANAARADLIDRVGGERVLIGEPARQLIGLGAESGGGPVAVVSPITIEQVVVILKIGRARHVPIVVRSRLPDIAADELEGCIVIDSRGLNRPPAIDISRRVVTVGAGVSLAAIDRAARQARLSLRSIPAFYQNDSIGAVLGLGEPGEIGLGGGSVLSDLIGATVVGGNGRVARVGGPQLIGQSSWPCEGLPDPASLVVGSEGRMAVICEVVLRLQPSPYVGWASARMGDSRRGIQRVLTAARLAISKRLVDTVIVEEKGKKAIVHVRAVTWRGGDDLDATCKQTAAIFGQQRISLADWQPEEGRVRLGHEAGEWPRQDPAHKATLDLRITWPAVQTCFDISEALVARGAENWKGKVQRQWAFGADCVRLRHIFSDAQVRRHPLIAGGRYFLDAGAVPIGVGSRLREMMRERMAPSSKVLLTSLIRAWDPENVVGAKFGMI